MTVHSCSRCAADLQPQGFGQPRKCAFDAAGHFTPENWNCATIDALIGTVHAPPPDEAAAGPRFGCAALEGNDESAHLVYGTDYGGWVVLTRYKHRGRTSGAVIAGDFWPARPLTLADADALLERVAPTKPPYPPLLAERREP